MLNILSRKHNTETSIKFIVHCLLYIGASNVAKLSHHLQHQHSMPALPQDQLLKDDGCVKVAEGSSSSWACVTQCGRPRRTFWLLIADSAPFVAAI